MEEIKISKKDSVACNYWKACDYYKQLKRLEKENEALRITREKLLGDLNIAEESLKDYRECYNRLEKENEELKEKNIELQLVLNEIDKTNNYRHALEEIREVLEYYANSWINPLQYPNLHYDNKKARDALLKVNEVLK